MDFSAFDTRQIDEYCARARENWGKTDVWKEFEQKQQGKTREDDLRAGADIMEIFARFGAAMNQGPESDTAQALVAELRAFITEHFYTCTVQILAGLGKMYSGGGEMTENIDRVGGPGTAEFAAAAVEAYCRRTGK